MGSRGRTSGAELTVAALGHVESIQRPDAPYDVDNEQAEEWRAVVSRMPADWFQRETHPLLTQHCRIVVRARRVAQLLNAMEKSEAFDVKEYRDLLRTEAELTSTLMSLATKMRLSQQTTYDKSKKKPGQVSKPWE